FGGTGMFFFMALYLQRVLGLSPIGTGLRLLATTGVAAAHAPAAARVIPRVGASRMLLAALSLELAGLAGLTQLAGDSTYGAIWPFLALIGVSLSIYPTAILDTILRNIPRAQAGLASGFQIAALNISTVVAVSVLGLILASTVVGRYRDALYSAG